MSPKEVAHISPDDVQTLDLETIQDESTETLIARGAAYARGYAAVEKAPTILAMNLATVLIAIRRQHGDWLGTTQAYRQDASEVYRQANIPKDQLTRLQGNVRYHVGNLIRRHLTPRELRKLGLLDSSPLERQQDSRATNAVLLAATKASVEAAESTPKKAPAGAVKGRATPDEEVVTPSNNAGHVVKATADHLRLATVAGNIVGQLDVDVISDHMTDGQRVKLDEELAELERAVRRLRRHLKTRRSEG